jgi:hypothetical protein
VAQHEERLGRGLGREVDEALGENGGLAGARAADDQQRAAGMYDGLTLCGGEGRNLRRIRRG